MSLPPSKLSQPRVADAHYSRVFDPWNSASTGHQVADHGGPQGWRESRTVKLNSQLGAGNGGGKRVYDTVGAGSLDSDARRKTLIPKEVRTRAKNSVADMLRQQGSSNASSPSSAFTEAGKPAPGSGSVSAEKAENAIILPESEREGPAAYGRTAEEAREAPKTEDEGRDELKDSEEQQGRKKIFDGLVIYVNGSTHPLISDIKLKHVLAENGARMSIHLGRRQVTHVILGRPAAGPRWGAGGGLASGKLEKEIRRVGGCSVKFVGVEWVLESIKAGKRLPEARFTNLKVAPIGQQSVYSTFLKNKTVQNTESTIISRDGQSTAHSGHGS